MLTSFPLIWSSQPEPAIRDSTSSPRLALRSCVLRNWIWQQPCGEIRENGRTMNLSSYHWRQYTTKPRLLRTNFNFGTLLFTVPIDQEVQQSQPKKISVPLAQKNGCSVSGQDVRRVPGTFGDRICFSRQIHIRARSESVGAAWVVLPSPEADEAFEIIADIFNAQLDNDAVACAKVQKLHSPG